MKYDKSNFTSILITKETKAELKSYMEKYKIKNNLDISYHKAIKALLNQEKEIDNLFVDSEENN
jgi:hypothetical protein